MLASAVNLLNFSYGGEPSAMRVVSETSQAALEKKRSAAKLGPPLQKLAANILRVMRGAGNSADLYTQMSHAIDASEAYSRTHGHQPFAAMIKGILHLDTPFEDFTKRLKEGRVTLFDVDRWIGDATLDEQRAVYKICRGSLQKCASRLIRQTAQERAGETELKNGILAYEESQRTRKGKPAE